MKHSPIMQNRDFKEVQDKISDLNQNLAKQVKARVKCMNIDDSRPSSVMKYSRNQLKMIDIPTRPSTTIRSRPETKSNLNNIKSSLLVECTTTNNEFKLNNLNLNSQLKPINSVLPRSKTPNNINDESDEDEETKTRKANLAAKSIKKVKKYVKKVIKLEVKQTEQKNNNIKINKSSLAFALKNKLINNSVDSDESDHNLENKPKYSYQRFKHQVAQLDDVVITDLKELYNFHKRLRNLQSTVDLYFKDLPSKLVKEKERARFIDILNHHQLSSVNDQYEIVRNKQIGESTKYQEAGQQNKFLNYDRGQKDFRKTEYNSVQLQICQQFPPKVAKRIIKILKLPSRRSDVKEIQKRVKEMLTWSVEEVFKFTFDIQNLNATECINVTDLIQFFNSTQCTSDLQEEFLLDIRRMMHFSYSKHTKNHTTTVKDVIKDHERVKIDIMNSTNHANRFVSKFSTQTFLQLAELRVIQNLYPTMNITQEEQVFEIDWSKDEEGREINLFFPNLWDYLLKIFTGFGLRNQDLDTGMNNRDMKKQEFIEKFYSLENAAKEYISLCKEMGLTKIFDMKTFERVKIRFPRKLLVFPLVKEAFFKLANPQSFIMTQDMLRLYFDRELGLKNVNHFIGILYNRIFSPRGQPVNMQRWFEVFYEWDRDPVKMMFILLDTQNLNIITYQDIQQYEDMFAWAPYVKLDFRQINAQLIDMKWDHMTLDGLRMALSNNFSRMSNFLLLFLQGSKLWMKFAQEPDTLTRLIFQPKFFPGFVRPASDLDYGQQYK